jgi:BMFP domain-containing protein YqiC
MKSEVEQEIRAMVANLSLPDVIAVLEGMIKREIEIMGDDDTNSSEEINKILKTNIATLFKTIDVVQEYEAFKELLNAKKIS